VARPLWHDELFTIWAARLSPARLVAALAHDSGPPLFYLLEKPFVAIAEAVGYDPLVRALSFVSALLLLLAARRLALGGARGWFVALVSCSPFILLYSQEARAYALLAALDLAVFVLLFCGRPTGRRLAAGAVAVAAALWTHYLAVFFVVVAGVLLLATRRWRGAAALAAGGLAFLPWLPVLRGQPADATAWIHETTGRSAVMFLAGLGGSARVPLPVGVPLPPALLYAAAAVGAVLAVLVATGVGDDRERRDALILTGGTLLLLLAVSFARPVAVAGRSEMAVLPIWLWALASGAGESRAVRVVAGAALALSVATCGITLAAARPEAAPSRMARLVAHAARPHDRVIASTAFYLPLRLAADRREISCPVLAFPPDLSLHPGWFVPAPPPEKAYGALVSELAGVPPGGRAFVVGHPLWAGPDLARALASAGSARDLVREPDALVLSWSAAKAANRPPAASRLPAGDREQGEAERRR
jgi:hypothetical protein